MAFVLVKTLYDEVNADLVKGNLMSQGIQVELKSASFGPTRYSRPNTFGIYVEEKDVEKARAIIGGLNLKPNAKPAGTISKILALVFLIALVIMLVYSIINIFKQGL